MDLLEFCKKLPKVELHAHLAGSLSEETLKALKVPPASLKGYQLINSIPNTTDRLNQCFKLFAVAHNATRHPAAVYFCTKSVIEEFYKDNVIYLELRTTPRDAPYITKRDYLEAVIRAIEDNRLPITVKLILSIDRSREADIIEEDMDVIIIMHRIYPHIIKGVDLSGNPNRGSFSEELFLKAKNNAFYITLHCAEIPNEAEVLDILNFKPNRIGHGTCIHPDYGGSDEIWNKYCELKIPLECCLTSNVLCGTSKSYREHPIKNWIDNKLPFNLNTDDKGVFCTTLSDEYYYAAKHFKLSKSDLVEYLLKATNYIFGNVQEKNLEYAKIEKWKEEMYADIYENVSECQ